MQLVLESLIIDKNLLGGDTCGCKKTCDPIAYKALWLNPAEFVGSLTHLASHWIQNKFDFIIEYGFKATPAAFSLHVVSK